MVSRRARAYILVLLFFLLCVALILATGVGAVQIAPASVIKALLHKIGIRFLGAPDRKEQTIIVLVRLPRVLASLLVGASLATAGAAMQGLFRNPMASPEILGVSAGASLGAVVSINTGLFALSMYFLPLLTVAGAAFSATLIYLVSTRRGRTTLLFVVISGMAISSFLNGLISAVLLFSKEYQVSQFIFWTMGGLDGRRWEHIRMVVPFLIPGIALLAVLSRELNLFLLGEEGAHSLGMNVELVKRVVLALSALITGVAVSISGTIGFVGLLVPHLLRLIVGPDYRVLLPASILGGALFLVACDLLGRIIMPPFEIRVGIITSIIGAPYLLFLIFRYQRKGRTDFGGV